MTRTKKLTVLLTISATLGACGAPEKAKVELPEEKGTTLAAVGSEGSWQLVQTVESAHPYTNDFERLWTVQGSAAATEMRVVFDRFELETGYDYLHVTDAGGAQSSDLTGTRTGEEIIIQGNQVDLFMQTDYSVTRWGFSVSVYERQPCVCAQIYAPVCGVNGNTYGNSCEANCAGAAIAHQGECRGAAWTPVPRLVESPHPYANNYDNSWTITEGGASHIRLHFSRIDVERGYDFVTVEDGSGNLVARYTGADQDVTTPAITGDTAVVRLSSDYSITRWGFALDRYEVMGGCTSDADCGQGELCNTQVQCIRAPCFNLCEPVSGGGYADVTVAQLEASPSTWDGQDVRVVTEPVAGPVACTRRGCSQSNPCCNTCSAGLMIGDGIALRDQSDQALGCRGNECNWESTCAPFPGANAGAYELFGTFMADSGSGRFALHDFRAVDCQPGGCSSQLCSNGGHAISTCEFKPEYACYQSATCTAQADGHCGWTQTPSLQMCIDAARGQRHVSSDTPVVIPDNDPAGADSKILVLGAGSTTRLLVSVNISHTYRGDLLVDLIAPTGETFRLHDGAGGSAHDLIFTDREITNASGLQQSGEWTLHVVDRYQRDTGTIDGWAIAFQ